MIRKILISFVLCFFVCNVGVSQAGIRSKVAIFLGTKALIKAVTNPSMQMKVINTIQKNPQLKSKVVSKLQSIVSSPKHIKIQQKSKDFLAKVENIKVPNKNPVTLPPATGPPLGLASSGAGFIPTGMLAAGTTSSTGLVTIGGRLPINSQWAGRVHPSGVEFTTQGFPNFSKYVIMSHDIRFTGSYAKDFALANKAFGLKSTPKGYTWHHHENGTTMQLISKSIHDQARHTGGMSIYKNGGKVD